MVFQSIDTVEGGFYPGQKINSVQSSVVTIIYDTVPLASSEVLSTSAVAISESPLVFPAPVNADQILGLTINGVYTTDFTYDAAAGTITVN